MSHNDLSDLLRDAAEPVPARVHTASAQDLADRIVASTPPSTAAVRVPARRRTRFALAAGVVAMAAVGATIAVPHLGAEPAFASWTPAPAPLPAADATAIVDECVPAAGYSLDEARAGRVVGETRGDYAYLSVITDGWTVTCFRAADGEILSPSLFEAPVTAAELGRTGVEMQAWPQSRTEEGYARLMTGRVGSDVTAVTVTITGSAEPRTVQASLQDGYFLVWYPEGLDESSTNTTTLTLTLTDGTTVPSISARDLHDAPRLG
ncbi:hypothetical protein J2S43_002979 [Catenuloplanes nepalensis]|uniref:Uncharacterized protein n=1 Tax=Catenuloplanes nepalensis TaxID=587533 RepID=A0ABT9MSQ3_9ACTN|nr:hypothetical protein [Catenuloplanes nepalensis]MDP9794467.1 hypothetical protein [Catenuloplanes nepalensis]